MGSIKDWFINLTRVGKLSVLSAVVLGGLFMASATPPSKEIEPAQADAPTAQQSEAPMPEIEYKDEIVETSIPYSKTTIEDSNLAKGTSEIRVAGVDGVKKTKYRVSIKDGQEVDRNLINEEATLPVTEVTAIGTYVAPKKSNCDTNYSGCVPDVGYDLDCADIGFSVQVLGYDKHGFDRDRDGYGCESY